MSHNEGCNLPFGKTPIAQRQSDAAGNSDHAFNWETSFKEDRNPLCWTIWQTRALAAALPISQLIRGNSRIRSLPESHFTQKQKAEICHLYKVNMTDAERQHPSADAQAKKPSHRGLNVKLCHLTSETRTACKCPVLCVIEIQNDKIGHSQNRSCSRPPQLRP